MRDQARRPIHQELLSIPGIAGAEFEGDSATPEGVRVQLAPGADPDRVGREVRRVLAGHGMRSQMTAPAVAPKQPPPPPEPLAVLNVAYLGDAAADPASPSPPTEDEDLPGTVDEAEDGPDEIAPDRVPADFSGETVAGPFGAVVVPILGDVVVKQRGGGVAVSVAAGERVVEVVAVASEEGIDQALLEAVCELLGVTPIPALVSVTVADQSGASIVTVLVDDGSSPQAGAAVSRGTRAWAVARAFWSAVSGPA